MNINLHTVIIAATMIACTVAFLAFRAPVEPVIVTECVVPPHAHPIEHHNPPHTGLSGG